MPKPDTSKEVEVKLPEEGKEVVVELDANDQPIKPAEKPKDEPRYVKPEDLEEKLKKANAAFFAESRKMQNQIRELTERLTPKEQQPLPTNRSQEQKDEYDLMLERGEWRTPVDKRAEMIAEKKFNELIQKQQAEYLARSEHEKRVSLLESNKQKVMERHPELEDPTSEKARVFREVVERNQDYTYNPFGPVLAMRDMEDILKSEGKLVDEPTRSMVEKEASRLARTSASRVPQGAQANSNGKIVLSKEEREFCDHHGIKYESYARNRKLTQTSGGVEA